MTSKNSVEKVYGVSEQSNFRISDESSEAVIEALIDLYKFPEKTTVREIASNIADATKEKLLFIKNNPNHPDLEWLDKDDFGEVTIMQENKLLGLDSCIVFRDKGIGMSEDRIRNVFTVIGASTKRGSNELIGGYGLGAKSPLSYSNIMYICTRFNGTERYYAVARNGGKISMNKIDDQPTLKLNGTEVIVPIKTADIPKFKEAIEKELVFFEYLKRDQPVDIVYEDQNMVILKNPPFNKVLPGNDKKTTLKLRVGVVWYDLEHGFDQKYQKLLETDIVLKCNVGEVDLVPSREGLRYTDKTVKLVTEKMDKVLDTLTKELNKEFVAATSFNDLVTRIAPKSNDMVNMMYYAEKIIGFTGIVYRGRTLKEIIKRWTGEYTIRKYEIVPNNKINFKHANYVKQGGYMINVYSAALLYNLFLCTDKLAIEDNVDNVLGKLADYLGREGHKCFHVMYANDKTLQPNFAKFDFILGEPDIKNYGDMVKYGEITRQRWLDARRKEKVAVASGPRVIRKAHGKFLARKMFLHDRYCRVATRGTPTEYLYQNIATIAEHVYWGETDELFDKVVRLVTENLYTKIGGINTYVYNFKKLLLLQCSPSIGKGIEENGGKHISTFFSSDNPLMEYYGTKIAIDKVLYEYKFLEHFHLYNKEMSNLYKKLKGNGIPSLTDHAKPYIKEFQQLLVVNTEVAKDIKTIERYVKGIEVLKMVNFLSNGKPPKSYCDADNEAAIIALLQRTGKMKKPVEQNVTPFTQLQIFG